MGETYSHAISVFYINIFFTLIVFQVNYSIDDIHLNGMRKLAARERTMTIRSRYDIAINRISIFIAVQRRSLTMWPPWREIAQASIVHRRDFHSDRADGTAEFPANYTP